MMTLRPKHSFESVIGNLATGLTSGKVRLSTELKDADTPDQPAYYSKAAGGRQAMYPKDDSSMLHPVGPSSKK
jgi:hypothetical protein